MNVCRTVWRWERTWAATIGNLTLTLWTSFFLLQDGAYTESVTLGLEGLVLRGNQLGQYTVLNAPLASGTIVTVNALEVFVEALDLRHNNATTSAREIGVPEELTYKAVDWEQALTVPMAANGRQ